MLFYLVGRLVVVDEIVEMFNVVCFNVSMSLKEL